MMNLGKKLGTAAVIAFACLGSAQAVVLDTFDYSATAEGNFNNSYDLSSATTDSWTINDINSFDADVTYSVSVSDEENNIKTANSIGGALGELSISTDVTASMTANLNYGALNGTPTAPINLAATGDAFYLDVVRSEEAGFLTEVTVSYLDTVSSTVLTSMASFSTSLITSLEREYVLFTEFAGVDFTQVTGINILFTGVAGADLTIAEIGTTSVPEPTSLAILGLGLLGFAASRKKA